jgi:hypothetical protein
MSKLKKVAQLVDQVLSDEEGYGYFDAINEIQEEAYRAGIDDGRAELSSEINEILEGLDK